MRKAAPSFNRLRLPALRREIIYFKYFEVPKYEQIRLLTTCIYSTRVLQYSESTYEHAYEYVSVTKALSLSQLDLGVQTSLCERTSLSQNV